MKWQVPAQENLVSFLQAQLGNPSGKSVRRLLEANLCRINGRVERFGSRKVERGDAVELAPSWKSALVPRSPQFVSLYEDDDLKIVDKPAGWVCKDEKAFGPGYSLAHRLDKDTTGLLILTKNGKARDGLRRLFENREIEKIYLALVDGVPKERSGIRKSLLTKKGAFQGQTIWGSGATGLTAITRWKTVAVCHKAALVLCEPETGRTHQIRVHLAEMGHPLLVDRQYAHTFRCPLFAARPLLHAYRLRFSWEGKTIDVKAPLPIDICEALRGVGVEMGQLRHLLREEEHHDRRDQRHGDEKAEEIKEPSHLIHQSGE